jgi:hypothetical protein
MPISRSLCLFLGVLAVACHAADILPPPHPTAVYAEYKGQKHLVVAAERDKPVILVDGKRVSLPNDTPLFTERTPGYSGIKATFTNERPVKQAIKRDRYNTIGAFDEKTVDISTDQDLRDCFLVIIHFEEEYLMTDEQLEQSRKKNAEIFHDRPVSRPQIHVHQIPDLKAKQSTTVTFSSVISIDPRYTNLPGAVGVGFKTFIIHPLFSEGREIRTNLPEIAATYFYHREKLLHQALLRQWIKQAGKADQPLKPVLQIPPLLDSTEGFPPNASATLSIAGDGTVSEAILDAEFPPDAAKILQNTLRAWLFLPKLKGGMPVPARVKVPLKF